TGQTTKKSKDKKALATNIANSTEFIPPSPTSSPLLSIHQHICPTCNQPINCKLTNNKHFLANDSMLFNDKPYHKSCIDNQRNSQQGSSKTTQQKSSNNTTIFVDKLRQTLTEQQSQNPLTSQLSPLTPFN